MVPPRHFSISALDLIAPIAGMARLDDSWTALPFWTTLMAAIDKCRSGGPRSAQPNPQRRHCHDGLHFPLAAVFIDECLAHSSARKIPRPKLHCGSRPLLQVANSSTLAR
jgi:hypothetical protein